jgi:hypothetical protein
LLYSRVPDTETVRQVMKTVASVELDHEKNGAFMMNEKPSLTPATQSRLQNAVLQGDSRDSFSKTDRRRSQRTLLVMPLAISWTTSTGMRVREHAETEVVSATGAMLRMKTRVPTHGNVEIKRPATNQSATVAVITVSNPSPDGWIRVAVEFTTPNTSFWGIVFPPLENIALDPMPPAKPTLASLLASRNASRVSLSGPQSATAAAVRGTLSAPAKLPGALTAARGGVK